MRSATNRSGLTPADLIQVILVREDGRNGAIPTTALVELAATARRLVRVGVPAVKVFASGGPRDALGSGGLDADGLMAHALYEIRSAAPGLEVMTENCLCSHTTTGDCHVLGADGRPDLDLAVEQIARQAVVHAAAGADVVGPASMIPGSVGAVRRALDAAGYPQVRIMPHLIWQSTLYEDYRTAMDAHPTGGRRLFQLDADDRTAGLRTALAMLADGADQLLLEPALTCTDLLMQLRIVDPAVECVPFSVSGEYARLRRAGNLGPLNEMCTMLARAGAARIATYAAAEIAGAMG